MQAAGYRTGYFGKWHLNEKLSHLPHTRGYDKAYTYVGGGYYNPKFTPAYKLEKPKRLSNVLTDMGIDFIKENKNKVISYVTQANNIITIGTRVESSRKLYHYMPKLSEEQQLKLLDNLDVTVTNQAYSTVKGSIDPRNLTHWNWKDNGSGHSCQR